MGSVETLRKAAVALADDHTVELLACDNGWAVTVGHPSHGGPKYDAAGGDTIEDALVDALRMIVGLRADGLVPAFPEVRR